MTVGSGILTFSGWHILDQLDRYRSEEATVLCKQLTEVQIGLRSFITDPL